MALNRRHTGQSIPTVLTDEDGVAVAVTGEALDVAEQYPPEYSFDEGAFQVTDTAVTKNTTRYLPGEIDGKLYMGFQPILKVDCTTNSGTFSVKVGFECLREGGVVAEFAQMTDASGAPILYGPYTSVDAAISWYTLPWVVVNASKIRAYVIEQVTTNDGVVALYASRRP